MIRLLTAALLFASFHAVAQTQVPNVFEDGGVQCELRCSRGRTATFLHIRSSYDGSAWVCASRLSGAITMIDRWYSSTGEGAALITWNSHKTVTLGGMRGLGNQMIFVTGSGHGFTFPETGIYRVDTTMSLRPSVHTTQSTYVRAQSSIDAAANWSNLGYLRAWDSNFGIDGGGQVYMSVSMSFT